MSSGAPAADMPVVSAEHLEELRVQLHVAERGPEAVRKAVARAFVHSM